MSRYCSPLRYPGGKNCIFPFVSNLFYENDLVGVAYAEPYAGGAGLALRLLFEEYVDRIYINDLDPAIYAFWKTVLERSDELCDWIDQVEVSMHNWHYFKKLQGQDLDFFETAKTTFFLNRTNVSGVLKGGVIGGYEQKGKFKIDARFNKDDLIARIRKIARFRERINVSNLDGLSFVRKMDAMREEVFIYLDPPYFQKGSDLYMNFYSKADHKKLSSYVGKIKNKWMVSYDNHEFILNLYANRKKVMYKLSQSASNRVGDEVLIFSERISFDQAVSSLSHPVYI
ncbi:DNA adenine methylase [Achromobacter xylosoxidans]|uniref:DNA adenine methylase n=1 Tax=Alcaligenes xylosoxydans xylosoxydans TaxID=85698 RepID=UPI0012329F8B|nr:DNA adenine methylase [Achromobacter xylosoxidans]KAA5918996.1 DNA adenine methylase [Achromobacter xylosoxidans]